MERSGRKWLRVVLAGAALVALIACRGTRQPAAAEVGVSGAGGPDPIVEVWPDRSEVGPGEVVSWVIAVSVPVSETERARQVELSFVPESPLRVTGGMGPQLLQNNLSLTVLVRNTVTLVEEARVVWSGRYYTRRAGVTQGVTPGPDGAAVLIRLGDIDPGGVVPARVETRWVE